MFAVAIPALVVENRRGTDAMSRSWNLVKGHFWHAFGLIVLTFIIVAVSEGIIGAIGTAISDNWFVVVDLQLRSPRSSWRRSRPRQRAALPRPSGSVRGAHRRRPAGGTEPLRVARAHRQATRAPVQGALVVAGPRPAGEGSAGSAGGPELPSRRLGERRYAHDRLARPLRVPRAVPCPLPRAGRQDRGVRRRSGRLTGARHGDRGRRRSLPAWHLEHGRGLRRERGPGGERWPWLGAPGPISSAPIRGQIVFGANSTSLLFHLSRSFARTIGPGDEVVVTRLDHDANIRPWVLAARDAGATVTWVDVRPDDATLDRRLVRSGAGTHDPGSSPSRSPRTPSAP